MNSAVFFSGDAVSQEDSTVSRERSQKKDSQPLEPPVSVVCC